MKSLLLAKRSSQFLTLIVLLTGFGAVASAQEFNKSFKVLPDAGSLEIITKTGSVTVVPAEGGSIQVSARRTSATINATQPTTQGKVKVEVTDEAPVDLTIGVPASTSVNVLCVKCGVTVRGIRGSINAVTTEGDIELTGIRSAKVVARSMSGNVSYSGEVLASGSYLLKSFSGRVDAFLPTGSKFKLEATSGRGGIAIDPGEFQLTVYKQTSHLVQGLVGSDGATVTLWTQDGSIRVKKR